MDPASSFSSKASDSDYGSSLSSCGLSRTSLSHRSGPLAHQSSLVSLISEISCTDSDSLEQLERENAHFTISESLIQVFEEIRWSGQENPDSACRLLVPASTPVPCHRSSAPALQREQSELPVHSEEDNCKQWVRFRSRLVAGEEDVSLSHSPSQSSLNDSDVDALNCSLTSQSFAEQLERLEPTALMPVVKNWGISLSNTSLFSLEDESASKNSEIDSVLDTSAENIAYSLLRRFSLVNDAEVQKARTNWIIGEDCSEVPQTLLPVPTSTPISPDQVEEEIVKSMSMVRLRGNFDWAPPRKQIIFSLHAPKTGSKKTQMALQNFRCAGCGQRIEPVYFPRMLFCHYIGKYFCQFGCHRNQKSIIPAHVLHKWDFSLYPVSNFAFNLIQSIRSEKLFDLQAQGFLSGLHKKSRTLSRLSYLRSQVIPLRRYISSCKRGGNVLLYYLIFDPKDLVNFDARDLYLFSLDDLVRIKSDPGLVDRMSQLVSTSIKHVSACSSCRARAFFCEICSSSGSRSRGLNKDVIFPFELGRVTCCQACGSCVHTKCLRHTPDHQCFKCKRRELRMAAADPARLTSQS